MTKVVWKMEKLKRQNFKSCIVFNHKHSFFITWIFYQLTDFCSNYAIQLKLMSDICEVWKNYSLKCGYPFNFSKNLKDRHFVVGGSKNLKLLTNPFLGVSLQKNVFSSFLLFPPVCYQDDLSNSERNEIASSTARNFNNSWLLYVKFSETINLCRNIWLIENWKCQLFLFLK